MSEKKNKKDKQNRIEIIIEKKTKYSTTINITTIERRDIKIIKLNLRKAKNKLRIVQDNAK